MKQLLFIACLLFTTAVLAQPCKKLFVDLKNGTLNRLKPTDPQEKIKAKLPCSTGETEDGSEYNCGGGVFYIKHDFYCYTGKDYIEFRKKFKGKLSISLLGITKAKALLLLKKLFGKPVRTETEGDTELLFFNTVYGSLRINIQGGKVVLVAIHSQSAVDAYLCS
jgi:hypothetical protein